MDAPAASVLHGLNAACATLDRLLAHLREVGDAPADLREVASAVANAVDRGPDVAIACILLNQIAGRYAVRHCIDTAVIASVLARAMGKPPLEVMTVAAAALTMNAGMMRQIEKFQDRTLPLSPDERALVHGHPAESAELLRCAGVGDEQWIACVTQHHENHDGSGYPDGLREAEIDLDAKLVGMADRYCACVSARNYRRSMAPPLALARLRADTANDPELVALFQECIGAYPPGTLVKLQNGELGVMAAAATVHVLRDDCGNAVSIVRDTGDMPIAEALHEDDARLRFSMKAVWGPLAAL
ncbi:HD domain-containing phosphohydrolase [Massilia sp. R2A-15]|uniref:HD-GYP domain-containing protein n=1 Tax=Massilia sp. R2A-15 TaxID=3064278 RepID=UPI0027363429|nr:HD domain-containing phosphohydrolase [Massilia sp. R2A-15]WLI90968.1 HD domain-containing phosphohydrolase [Massilia sp. R2A-15]